MNNNNGRKYSTETKTGKAQFYLDNRSENYLRKKELWDEASKIEKEKRSEQWWGGDRGKLWVEEMHRTEIAF